MLVNILESKFNFSGIEDDEKFEGPSTRSEKEKQIRARNFQSDIVWILTESIAVFFRHLSSMAAEKMMKQCMETHCSLCCQVQ